MAWVGSIWLCLASAYVEGGEAINELCMFVAGGCVTEIYDAVPISYFGRS